MNQENPEYYDENQEIWRECIGYEGLYLVSNFGRVKSLYPSTRIKDKENYVMTPKIDNHGYKRVNLHKDKNNKAELISRLVANTFIPNPENKPMVGHWDDDKLNNNVDNLYWTDSYENNHHNGKYEKFLKAHNDNIENIVKKDCYSLGSTGIYDAKYFFNALVYDHNAPYSPGCAVFRKDSLKVLYSFSGSDEVQVLKTGAGVDLLMFLLALERKPKFYYINKTLCFFRWHSGSITVSNQMVPMGYMCALKYFFEKYNYFKYIKWIRVENRLFALKKRLLKKGIPGDVFNYYQKIKMIETGLCNFNIYVSVIACYIRRKLTNN